MRLTRGERRAAWLYTLVVVGLMPPVIVWANRVEPWVLDLPFFFFWIALMVVLTSVVMSVALVVQERTDRR
jgi:hypothetical protein